MSLTCVIKTFIDLFTPEPWGKTLALNVIGLPSQCSRSKPLNIMCASHEDKTHGNYNISLNKNQLRKHFIPSSYRFLVWLFLFFLTFYWFVVNFTSCASVSTHVPAPPYLPSTFVSLLQKQTNTENQKVKTNISRWKLWRVMVCCTIYPFGPRALIVNVIVISR